MMKVGAKLSSADAGADVAGHDDDAEQRDADRPADDLDRAAAEHAARARAAAAATAVLSSLRLRPQQRERRERDHQHRGAAPGEQHLVDRQRRSRWIGPPWASTERDEVACASSAVLSASSNAFRPNEPSRRAVTFPSAPTTNSHGSVRSRNACSGGAQARVRVVVDVDLLVDELHLVAVLGLHLQRDVGDRAADARLAELRRREQQRHRLLAERPRRSCARACRSAACACRAAPRRRRRRPACRSPPSAPARRRPGSGRPSWW